MFNNFCRNKEIHELLKTLQEMLTVTGFRSLEIMLGPNRNQSNSDWNPVRESVRNLQEKCSKIHVI
jgi:pentatricopeptide repeat protein